MLGNGTEYCVCVPCLFKQHATKIIKTILCLSSINTKMQAAIWLATINFIIQLIETTIEARLHWTYNVHEEIG